MSRQAVFAHRGNVPDVGSEKLSVKRLSWMGTTKTESVLVTFEDGDRVAQAEKARKQREKVMGNIRTQLSRINEMLESPARNNNNGDNSNGSSSAKRDRGGVDGANQEHSPSSAMSTARSRQADPKQLISYLDGTSHSRFSIANYNAYVRAKMVEIMEANPPNSSWPLLPTDEEFPVPSISEGTGISPSNVTSAATWRDMLGGRGTMGYNTKATACAKELLASFEPFNGVNFGEGFNDKATAAGAASPQQQPAAAEQTEKDTSRPADATTTAEQQQQAPVASDEKKPEEEASAATQNETAAAPSTADENKTSTAAPSAAPATTEDNNAAVRNVDDSNNTAPTTAAPSS